MKQVILVRQDLKMDKGKLATQCAHASVDAVLASSREKVDAWRDEGMKKVVVKVKDEALFFRVIRTAFSQRRKTLANSLKPVSPDIKEILPLAGIEPNRRAETLSIEEFAKLSDTLYKQRGADLG